MVRWKMNRLIQRYEEVTGASIKATQLMREADLSPSTTYLVLRGEPLRISLKSIDSLLSFFSHYLGPLEISDLIEFEVEGKS